MKLKIKKLNSDAIIPTRANPTDSGADLYSCLDGVSTVIYPFSRKLIPTGIAIELPEPVVLDFTSSEGWARGGLRIQWEAQVRSKSGRALNEGLFVLNSPGTIDYGYSGELRIILYNSTYNAVTILHHEKIAQLVLCPIVVPVLEEVAVMSVNQDRGDHGFGSSGLYLAA